MDNKLLQVSLKYLYQHCTMFRCATRSFSKQGRFCGISALWWTLSSKTQESKVLQAKHFKVFLLATFKTTFWMENLTQKLKKKKRRGLPLFLDAYLCNILRANPISCSLCLVKILKIHTILRSLSAPFIVILRLFRSIF